MEICNSRAGFCNFCAGIACFYTGITDFYKEIAETCAGIADFYTGIVNFCAGIAETCAEIVHFHTAICRLQTGFPAENLHFIKKNAASGTGAIQIVAKGRSCAVIRKNGDFSSLPTASVIANPQGEAIHTRTLDCFILRIRNDGCDSLKCRALDGLFLRISLKNGIFDYSKMTSTQIFSDKHPERLLPPSDGIPNFLLNPSAAQ